MTDKVELPGAQTCMQLRSDLRCSLQRNNGKPFYMIEDPATGSFYRLGVSEWELAQRLDGRTELAEAVARINRDDDDQTTITPQQAEGLAHFLASSGLILPIVPKGCVGDNRVSRGRTQSSSKLNPFFVRIPLFCPDSILATALPWCRWLIGRPFLTIWLVVVILGAYSVFAQWNRFTDTAQVYLAPWTWLYLWLAWCFLKVVHEFFHGLSCKKYGGHVGSAGVALILFSPVAFLDVSSAWRFRSKWQRICTSAAGIYIELLVAGLAAIVWSYQRTGMLSHICHSVIMMASLTTVLFNANPLMRFDGYYMLSDLLEIQNLYGNGQKYVRGLLRRVFLGLSTHTAAERDAIRRCMINTYGVATAVWRVIVCVSMVLLASTLFQGAGLVVGLFGVVSWFAVPCFRLGKLLVFGGEREQPNRFRFVVVSALVFLLALCGLMVPWPGGVSAHASVVYATDEVIRTATAGFVEQVHVVAGQTVEKGQLLVTLRNDDLRAAYEEAKLSVQRSLIRSRILLHRKHQAGYQAELEGLTALRKRQSHLQSQVEGLLVKATRDGTVLGRGPEELLGKFMDLGQPLLKVADSREKEIQLSISETHFDVFLKQVGTVPQVTIVGQPGNLRAGKLVKVEPRASVVLRNQALAGSYGGPLAVRVTRSGGRASNAGRTAFELEAPRFHGVVDLPADESSRLKAGQLAKVRIRDRSETLGRVAYRGVKSWIQRKLNQRMTTASH